MAFEQFNLNEALSRRTGSYGESVANEAAGYLRRLRGALDSGELSVTEFVKLGKPVAETALKEVGRIAGGGKGAANAVNPVVGVLAEAGFTHAGNKNNNPGAPIVQPSLPEQYQQKLREEIVPTNLDPEARAKIINSIPNDVDLFSDEGRIEQERIRQLIESEKALAGRKTERQTKLDELAGLLSSRRDTLQERAIPQITEQSNAAGQLDTTAYGQAIANNLTKLEEDSQFALSSQALSDRDVNMAEALDILGRSQQFQTAGLERTFSREDQSRSQDFAMRLAELSKPTQPSKTSGEKWLNGINTTANVVQAIRGGGK